MTREMGDSEYLKEKETGIKEDFEGEVNKILMDINHINKGSSPEKESQGDEIEKYTKRLEELKDEVKRLKQIKKQQKKISKLEEKRIDVIKEIERKKKHERKLKKKHKH